MRVVFPDEHTAVLACRVTRTPGRRGEAGNQVQQMADSSTWERRDGRWRCVVHTGTPREGGGGPA